AFSAADSVSMTVERNRDWLMPSVLRASTMKALLAFGPKFLRRGCVMLTLQEVSNSVVFPLTVGCGVLSIASRWIWYLPSVWRGVDGILQRQDGGRGGRGLGRRGRARRGGGGRRGGVLCSGARAGQGRREDQDHEKGQGRARHASCHQITSVSVAAHENGGRN